MERCKINRGILSGPLFRAQAWGMVAGPDNMPFFIWRGE